MADLMVNLQEGHSLLFAATTLEDGIRETVRSYKNGSRVIHIPFDLFPFTGEEK